MRFLAVTAALFSAIAALPAPTTSAIAPSASATIEFWHDLDRTGIHSILIAETGRCHEVGADDNDQITSLRVGAGFICDFFQNKKCNLQDRYLRVVGETTYTDLRKYNFDDIITSFVCRAI